MKKRFLLVMIFAILMSVMSSSSAYAAINGREVQAKFDSNTLGSCGVYWTVTITGKNQDGTPATWKKTAKPHWLTCTIKADKWWWKGSVTVTAESNDKFWGYKKYSKTVTVNDVGGVYTVKLP